MEAWLSPLTTLLHFLGFVGQVVKASDHIDPQPAAAFAGTRWFSISIWLAFARLALSDLMSFLIGIVIAQQGAVQLRQFGAEVFTINLIGRLTFRELAY